MRCIWHKRIKTPKGAKTVCRFDGSRRNSCRKDCPHYKKPFIFRVLKRLEELQYQGGSLEEIAAQIQRDENDLLEYMTTGDDMGQKSFVFAGFMFRKDMIEAAQMTEPEF